MIEKEDLFSFLDKEVQLIKADGFALYGVIRKINNGSVVFETNQTTSTIALERIHEVRLRQVGNND